jgi:antirestriction protein ArdC
VASVEFGHYEPATDTVRLSRRLDSPDVPPFVLEHVMHHELLHRVLGAERRGDRRRYHSARFRREERRFEGYPEAEAFLEKLAER